MTRSDPEREARLAAALRDNLRRRKAQARGTPDEPPQAGGAPDVTPDASAPTGDQNKDDTQPASE